MLESILNRRSLIWFAVALLMLGTMVFMQRAGPGALVPTASAHGIPTPYCTVTDGYSVCADQLDYSPESAVHLYGSGFATNAILTIRVTRPNGSVVSGDGTFEPWPKPYDDVVVGGDGYFDFDYILNGVLGEYLVDVLDSNGNVLATHAFLDDAKTLTVTLMGTGSGTVTSDDASGINCDGSIGSDCSKNYGAGTVVVLTATPDSGSEFAGWTGDVA